MKRAVAWNVQILAGIILLLIILFVIFLLLRTTAQTSTSVASGAIDKFFGWFS